MTQRQLRTVGLVIVLAGAWLILSPRLGGPTTLASIPIQYIGWPILAAGWIVIYRAMKLRSGDDG